MTIADFLGLSSREAPKSRPEMREVAGSEAQVTGEATATRFRVLNGALDNLPLARASLKGQVESHGSEAAAGQYLADQAEVFAQAEALAGSAGEAILDYELQRRAGADEHATSHTGFDPEGEARTRARQAQEAVVAAQQQGGVSAEAFFAEHFDMPPASDPGEMQGHAVAPAAPVSKIDTTAPPPALAYVERLRADMAADSVPAGPVALPADPEQAARAAEARQKLAEFYAQTDTGPYRMAA